MLIKNIFVAVRRFDTEHQAVALFSLLHVIGVGLAYAVLGPRVLAAGNSSTEAVDWPVLLVTAVSDLAVLEVLLYVIAVLLCGDGKRAGRLRAVTVFLISIHALLILGILLDFTLFNLLGTHLLDPMIIDYMQNPWIQKEINLSTGSIVMMGAVLLLIAAAEVGVRHGCRRFVVLLAAWQLPVRRILVFAVVILVVPCAVATITVRHRNPAAARQADRATLLRQIIARVRVDDERKSEYTRPLHERYAAAEFPRLQRRPDILLIQVESLRADIFGTTPHPKIEEFVAQYPVQESACHMSGATGTDYGTFSLLYGLSGIHFMACSEHGHRSWPLELLRANGYEVHGVTSSNLRKWQPAFFLNDQFDSLEAYTHLRFDHADRAAVTWLREFHRKRQRDRPLFQFVFLASPHYNYFYPEQYEVDTPVFDPESIQTIGITRLRGQRELLINRYRNSIRYVDALVGEILEIYRDELARDELVVVVTGDHGEEFWEHGLFGHIAPLFYNERMQVPYIMYLPGVEPRTLPLSSHMDILPTIIDYCRPEEAFDLSAYVSGRSLLQPATAPVLATVTATGFPRADGRFCFVTEAYKHWVELQFGTIVPQRSTDLQDRPVDGADVVRSLNWCLRQHAAEVDRLHVPR